MLGVAERMSVFRRSIGDTSVVTHAPEGLWTRNEAVAGEIWAQALAMVTLAVGTLTLVGLVACGAGAANTLGARSVGIPTNDRT